MPAALLWSCLKPLSSRVKDGSPSCSWDLLRFSPSTADTERLLGSLALLEGEPSSWLNRFLLTLVTSEEPQSGIRPELHVCSDQCLWAG